MIALHFDGLQATYANPKPILLIPSYNMFYPEELDPTAIILKVPANNMRHANSRGMLLTWEATHATFDVFIGTDSISLEKVGTGIKELRYSTGPLEIGTTYFWRVIGNRENGSKDTSETWSFRTDPFELICRKFIPSADPLAFDTEGDSRLEEISKVIDLGKVGLMIMDFWAVTLDQFPNASQNILSLVNHARSLGIPIFHLLHEGWQSPAIAADSNEFVIDLSNYNYYLEEYFEANDISTLIVVGYGAGECVTISRVNSIYRISQRVPDRLDFILLRDCTEGGNQFEWAINGVETKYQTSTLGNLYSALQIADTVLPTLGQIAGPFYKRYNFDFPSADTNLDTVALILLNIWESHPNDGFEQKIKNNTTTAILPLLKFARSRGMQVVHVPNGREIDHRVNPQEGEFVLHPLGTPAADKARLTQYLKGKGIRTIVVAGNLDNTSPIFPLLDAWGLSTHNGLPAAWTFEAAFNTCFIEDAITAFESPTSMATSLFKETYLSRATWYEINRSHFISPLSAFRFNINTAPQFVTLPKTVAFLNENYEYQAQALDKESETFGDKVVYSLLQGPHWLQIDSTTGHLSGVPVLGDEGTFVVKIEATDSIGATGVQVFSLFVRQANLPPVFTTTPDTTATEDQPYGYHAYASDPDSALFGDTVSYRLVNPPSWLSIDSTTGLVSGMPRVHHLPDTVVTIEAYDQWGGVAQQSYTLHIQHVNHVPEILSTPVFVAKEDSLYRYQVVAVDPDTLVGDVLSYTLTRKPGWLSVNSSTGLISGIPAGINVGDTVVTVRVSDGVGGIATQTYNLRVLHTNHAPVFVSMPDTVAIEDSLYSYQSYATDQDSALFGDVVRYRFSVRPMWLSIDSVTGLVQGTPVWIQAQDTVVGIEAYDNKGGVTEQRYALRVIHVNHEPQIISMPVTVAKEDSLYRYQVVAVDQDTIFGDVLRYSLTTHPSWLRVDSVGGLISGIPAGINVGDTVVTVRVSDGVGGITTQTYQLKVLHTNHAPVFVSVPDTVAREDSVYRYRAYAVDEDSALFGDVVRYALISGPAWLSIDTTISVLHGVPGRDEVGTHAVIVAALDDKGGVAEQMFTVHVLQINKSPRIVGMMDSLAYDDRSFTTWVIAVDPDTAFGDSIRYELLSGPQWIKLDTLTGNLAGVPLPEDVGDTSISVRVFDRFGLMDQGTFLLRVVHVNRSPLFTSIADSVAVEDSLYAYQARAVDPDSALFGDVVRYRLVIKPVWLSVDSLSGLVMGTPHGVYAQDTVVAIEAYDNNGGVARQQYDLRVEPVNHLPMFTSFPDSIAYEDSLYVYHAVVFDSDVPHRDTLRFRLMVKPVWLQIDSLAGTIFGTPRGKDVGDTIVAIAVTDVKGGYAEQVFTLTVLRSNHAPVFTSVPKLTAVEDQVYAYAARAIDIDSALFGDTVGYRLIGEPVVGNARRWLSIDSSTGIVSGIPRVGNLRDTAVTIEAYDQWGGVAQQSYTLHIQHVNHVPEITSTPVFVAKEDSLYRYQVIAVDSDTLVGDVLSYTLTKKPGWLSVNSSTGLISGIPAGINVGDTVVTVRVSDGVGGIATQTYNLRVLHTNHAPVFVSMPDTVAIEDSLYSYQSYATDQDSALFGDVVRYRFSVRPMWLSIDSVTGLVQGTPVWIQAQDTVVGIEAYDNKGGVTEQRYALRVIHVNHEPQIISMPVTVAKEDSLYRYQVVAVDQDTIFGDVPRYSLTTHPSWLRVDSVGGLISGIPGGEDVGDTVVTVRVSDGVGGIATQTYQLKVLAMYYPPSSVVMLSPKRDSIITLAVPSRLIEFNWGIPKAYRPVDSLRYSFKLRGVSIDTVIAGLKDTSLALDIMPLLRVSSKYIWWVDVADGRAVTPAADTMEFWTSGTITSLESPSEIVPEDFVLERNFPNPFNPSTTIRYGLPERSRVSLVVHNLLGQVVERLFEGEVEKGYHHVLWSPVQAASGVYFVLMQAESISTPRRHTRLIQKILLVR